MIAYWKASWSLHPLVRGGRRWAVRHETEIASWKEEYQSEWLWLCALGLSLCVLITVTLWVQSATSWEWIVARVATTVNSWVSVVYVLWRLFRESVEHHLNRNLNHILGDWRWYADYEATHEQDQLDRQKLIVRVRADKVPVSYQDAL